jgi:hypothetical protein
MREFIRHHPTRKGRIRALLEILPWNSSFSTTLYFSSHFSFHLMSGLLYLVTIPELLSEQYSLHDEIAENNGSGRSMGNRIGRDTVSSQLV